MKFLICCVLVGSALVPVVQVTAAPPVLSQEERTAILQLRREYTAARAEPAAQLAIVAKAIEIGPLGIERLVPLVQNDMDKALTAYVNLFAKAAQRSADGNVVAIVANHPQLTEQRQRLVVLGEMWSQLQAAGDGESFDPEQLLREREEQVIRQLKLGPIYSQLDDEEIAAINATNKQRAEHGLPPLEVDLKLCLTARDHSKDMIQHGFFAHESPVVGKTTPADRGKRFDVVVNGENIYAGSTSGTVAVEAWMNSEGHRANILKDGYRRIGLGRVDKHWTQVFGN